jgi:glycosyltransferase involved in cell wall biosynthesis
VAGGGIRSENRLFGRIGTPDPVLEERLVRAVTDFDVVVTMGSGAARFFREHGARGEIHVVPGGIDGSRFRAGQAPRVTDLAFVGRLVPLKGADLFLRAAARVAEERPGLTAVVAGEGPLRGALESLASELGLGGRVSFLGQRGDVEEILRRARILVLTSETEGLPLVVLEAMMCGVPAVVGDVGDLADVVEDGVSGYRVRERTSEAFASPILDLLQDPERWARFSCAARRSAAAYEIAETARRWDAILGGTPQ